jgi:hypothetical protein
MDIEGFYTPPLALGTLGKIPHPGASRMIMSITTLNTFCCGFRMSNNMGTWDCDHWMLYVFEQARWQDIVENPAPYINCQWDESQTVGTLFQPQGAYPMKQGWPI